MSALQTDILTEALHGAGLPPGVLNIVTGSGAVAGAALSAHPDVAKVSFTGSTATGRAILRAAADSFKRVALELGGKGPSLILAGADLDRAARIAAGAGLMNSGHACVAGTRILASSADGSRPPLFIGVRNDMRIAREEIFGPVLSVIAYDGEEEAIANDSPYGLQAYVTGGDPDQDRAVADRLECGRVVIDGAAHEPLAPFGGMKQSGIGREFGQYGLMAHLEPRAVVLP